MNSIGPSSSPSEARFPRKGILNIRLPHIVISDRTLEALKWIALLLMTGDHVNKYLFNGTKEWLFDFGRLAMPLFVFVLAYNLARPDTLARGVYHRTIWRLFFVGCLSTPPFIALGNVAYGWWPFNIMFTLAATAGVLLLIDRGSMSRYAMAGALFVAAGSVVEFCWPALGLGVTTWLYVRRPSWMALGVAVAALGGVLYVNGNGVGHSSHSARLGRFSCAFRHAATSLGLLLVLPSPPGGPAAHPHPYEQNGLPLLLTGSPCALHCISPRSRHC